MSQEEESASSELNETASENILLDKGSQNNNEINDSSSMCSTFDREIVTPTFYTNEEYAKITAIPWEIKYNEMEKKHWKLECLERIIKNKEIPNIVDVNMIAELSVSRENNLVFFGDEEEMSINPSQCIKERNEKPAFWPSRSYDDKFIKLKITESEQLRSRIDQCIEDVEIDGLEEPAVKKIKNRKFDSKYSVTFSLLDFETDNDDEQTQWSDDDVL